MRQGQITLTHKEAQVPNPHEVELDTGIRWSSNADNGINRMDSVSNITNAINNTT